MVNGSPHRHGVLGKFAALLGAHGVRELLQAAFLIYLARSDVLTYGRFTLALGIGQILFTVAEFGLNPLLVMRLSRNREREAQALWPVLAIRSGLLSLGGLVVWGFVLSQRYEEGLVLPLALIVAGVAFEAIAAGLFVVLQVRGRQRVEGALRSTAAACGFGYGLAALALGAPIPLVAVYKLVEATLQIVGAGWFVMRRLGVRLAMPSRAAISGTLRAAWIYALIQTAAILYNKINLLFLQRYAGGRGVAQYSATWQVVDGITCLVCNLLLARTLFPLFAKLVGSRFDDACALARSTSRWLLLLAAVIMFILVAESDRIIPLIYGPNYGQAIWMQRWLAATVAIGFLHNLAGYLMISSGRTRYLLSAHAAGLAVCVVLCLVLIPRSPLGGSVASLLLAKLVVAVLTVGFGLRQFRMVALRDMITVLCAVLLGAAAYGLLFGVLGRTAAEAAALVPAAGVALRWQRHAPKAETAR